MGEMKGGCSGLRPREVSQSGSRGIVLSTRAHSSASRTHGRLSTKHRLVQVKLACPEISCQIWCCVLEVVTVVSRTPAITRPVPRYRLACDKANKANLLYLGTHVKHLAT